MIRNKKVGDNLETITLTDKIKKLDNNRVLAHFKNKQDKHQT